MVNHDKQQGASSDDESKKTKVSFGEVVTDVCTMTASLFGFLLILLSLLFTSLNE
jgi:hypothetical protein